MAATDVATAKAAVETKLAAIADYLLPTSTGPGVHFDAIGFAERLAKLEVSLGQAQNAATPFEETTYVD